MSQNLDDFKTALRKDDAPAAAEILAANPDIKARLNDRSGDFGSPVLCNVRSRAMFDVLHSAGADLNSKSDWWAGGFGFLHTAEPDLALYAIERGAAVDAHAAARLGLFEKLKEIVSANPKVVHERGGDGQSPLHFASTVEIAAYLLDHGADIDMRDLDHQSTAAQWNIKSHPDVARYLVSKGCAADIMMASALGDTDLVHSLLDRDPESIRMRVSNEWFPMVGGGSIYQWELGWYVSAHQVAKAFGHPNVFDLLMERSPRDVKVLAACWLGDEKLLDSLLKHGFPAFSAADQRHTAHAARNDEYDPLRLLLKAGLPVTSTGQHNMTSLHWAAWHGNARAVEAILTFGPDLERRDNEFNCTPLGAAIDGSENSWHPGRGDFGRVVEALLGAGAKPPAKLGGTEAVREVLRRHGVTSS